MKKNWWSEKSQKSVTYYLNGPLQPKLYLPENIWSQKPQSTMLKNLTPILDEDDAN